MSNKRPSRLRFNFGFFLEATLGTSRTIELNYPTIEVEDLTLSPLAGTFTATRTSEGVYLSGVLRSTFLGNGSGDFVIAFSTAYRIPHGGPPALPASGLLGNEQMNPLFMAVVEATEEAIYNSLFMATTVVGMGGRTREAISMDVIR